MRIPLLTLLARRVLLATLPFIVLSPGVGRAWVPIGPDGGTISAIAVDPGNPSTVYAAVFAGPDDGEGRGIYKSSNGGMSWTLSSIGLGTLAVSQIVVNPHNSQILFAATFGGVYRSTNGGASWSSTIGTPSDPYAAFVIDPLNPSNLYLATQHGVYRSTNGGGLFSASNSGLTQLVVSALAIDPANPQVLYAATFDGVFKSSDGASTWTLSTTGLPGPGVQFLAVDPTSSSKVYAGGCALGMYRSIDGGSTWSASNTGLPSATGCVVALAAQPGTAGTLYAALTDDAQHPVFVSTDFAATWAPLGSGLEGHVVDGLALIPILPSIVFAGTQGGVFRSTDAGATWALRTSGIRHTGMVTVAVDPHAPATLYGGGNADGPASVVKSVDGGVSWSQIGPAARTPAFTSAIADANVLQVVIDPTDSAKIYLATTSGIFRSSDAGTTWTWSAAQNAPFVNWIAVDPLAPSVLYMGTQGDGFQKSADGGATWAVMNSGLPIPFIMSVAPDPQHEGTVYASLAFHGVFKSLDGAASWTAINNGFPNPSSIGFSNVIIDPTNSDILYVEALGVYRSADAGASWTLVGPSGGGSPLAIDPLHPATLFAADQMTVDKSTDSGATWNSVSSAGLSNYVQGFAVDPTTGATAYAAAVDGIFRSTTSITICTSAADCDDGNLCTTDSCDPGGAGADPGTGCRNAPIECDTQCHASPGFCDGGTGACVYSSPAFPDGTACDDGNLCTFDRCLGGVCAGNPVPEPTCMSAGSTRLLMRQGADPAHRRLVWRWNHGSTVENDFGNPLTVSRYTLCVYDRSGPGGDPVLLLAASPPVGALSCGGSPCWRFTNGGFTYKDRSAASDGLTDVKLHDGDGRAKIFLKGRGAALELPATPVVPRLTVQLRRADGTTRRCWGADYEDGFDIQQNDAESFKGKTH
ncbi:MAG TPA: hypothetical protein VGK30_10575 [Candidatus Binatia bacterium]|jgi:photosystem II stability/assembly factor-like uncharacterized protein